MSAVLLLFALSTAHALTQDSLTLRPAVVPDTLAALRRKLADKQSERIRLERMLAALNTVDTVYKAHCPTWIVLDEDLKYRIRKLFQMRFPDLAAQDSDIVVITSPRQSQILEIAAGKAVMGRRDVRVNLSDSLNDEILSGRYPKRTVEPAPPPTQNSMLFGYTPRFAALSMSAFGATLLFNNGRGIEVRLGDEQIGYHFWSTGSLQAMVLLEQLKLGIIAPFTYGNGAPDHLEPLSIKPRKLTGSKGIAAEYNYPFQTEQVSASFKIGEIRGITNPDLLASSSAIYALHTVAQLTYSRQEFLGGGRHLITLKGGVGYHQIVEGKFVADGSLAATRKVDFASPIIAADYVHQGDILYGAGIQYYNSVIFAKCWIELIKDFLFVDLKYYAPVFRDAKPWEQPYFFMISPRIQVVY